MQKILFFPLLNSLPSGHHQVADSLCEAIHDHSDAVQCKKVDLLSEWNPKVESAAVSVYLKWIRYFPHSYAWTYRKFAYNKDQKPLSLHYELLFKRKIEKILAVEKPDLIVCTHAFPSMIINRLKMEGTCKVPCLNVYTDFFINKVWGTSHIDYHFASHAEIKNQLEQQHGISPFRIFTTGIPVSRKFQSGRAEKGEGLPLTILMAGGSAGLGNFKALLDGMAVQTDCRFNILCGTNKALHEKVSNSKMASATPYPYISSKAEMNQLYSSSDAIVTKPGGVTVSEALKTELPIFVHSALPGQEEINLRFLSKKSLVFQVPLHENMPKYVIEILSDEKKMQEYRKAVMTYKESLELKDLKEIFDCIQQLIKAG